MGVKQAQQTGNQGRGRSAERPEEIPARGWWDITWRVIQDLGNDNVSLVAAGMAMYALLSVFPGLAAAVSIYGMFATPTDVAHQMSAFAGVLPPGVWDIFKSELAHITSRQQDTLSVAAAIGVLLALWSARSAMSSLMTATNIAYKEREKRSFVRQVLVSLALTVGAVIGFLLILLIGVAVPVGLRLLGTAAWVQTVGAVVRWIVLYAFAVCALALVYRYAPAREPAKWHWLSWGSTIAALLWLGASVLFAVYVRNFASYGVTYGTLGGVVVLLMWFYISGYVVVLGVEINAEMERQTVKDTTEGPPAPMGERGAYAADTVGPPAGKPDRDAPPKDQAIRNR